MDHIIGEKLNENELGNINSLFFYYNYSFIILKIFNLFTATGVNQLLFLNDVPNFNFRGN